MTESENKKDKNEMDEDIQIEKELDQEALDVIFRLYDKTFKDLAKR